MAQNILQSAAVSAIDIRHYKINLQFDWAKKKAAGEVTISVGFTQSTQTISLVAHDLLIHAVHTTTQKNIAFATDTLRHLLVLSLDKSYNKGEALDIVIVYETQHHNAPDPNAIGGSFGKGIRFFQPTPTNPIKRKQLWSQSELQNTSYWLPCSPELSDLSTTEIIATVENGLTFIANGKLLQKKDNVDGTVTFHYLTSRAYPIYLTAFAAGVYADLIQYHKGIPLHTYCYPDEQEAAKATTVRLPEMMAFLETQTGFVYPFSQYSQVMVQDYPFPSLTGQNTFSIISDNMIDDYGTHRDFLYLWDGVEFNALASQWFGNVIAPKNVEDIWLTKSFAQYFEGLFTTHKNGLEEYLLWYHPFEMGSVWGDWNNGNRHPIVPKKANDAELFAGDSYAKYRGALVLRMLQKEIGDSLFFKSIRHFVKKNAFKPVTTSDFQQAIKEVTGNDMQWFFEQWFYTIGHPIFQITNHFDPKNKLYHLKIKQIQALDSTSTYPQQRYFRGKMEVEIDHKKEVIQLLPQQENTFSFRLSRPPHMVNVDVAHTWIGEIQWAKPWEEWLNLFLYSKDMGTRSNAMNELVQIAKSKETPLSTKNKIVQAFQKVIQSKAAYWRFRFNVLGQLRNLQSTPYDQTTTNLLVSLIKQETSWVKAAALTSLGMTNDSTYADLYISCFTDTSDRVINAAAVALGRTKSAKAFEALIKLKNKPSWKNQSLMHCLGGLAQLGDTRAESIALAALSNIQSPRWFLGNGWDYPFIAAQTLAQLGTTEKAYQIVLQHFRTAMKNNDTDDIFHQVLLITTLANPKGQEIFEELKIKYKHDANAMNAIAAFEEQLKVATSK